MKIIIKMSDGSKWSVDPKVISKSYQEYYDEQPSDSDELIDWAKNDMNWEELQAIMIKEPDPVDYSEMYLDAEFEVEHYE